MKVPYHGLLVCGDVLLATRGCNLHTFSIKDGSHLCTWTIPSLKKEELSEATPGPENGSSDPTPVPDEVEAPAAEDGDSGPPSKRRKVERDEDVEQDEPDQEVGPKDGENVTVKTRKRGRKNKRKAHPLPFIPKPAEQPMVQCLTATPDGKHIVAVTGLDKTIWVFAHDGAGNLKQLSKRPMPKRPSSIALTPDNKTILSADKFGDVISLPLLPLDEPTNESPQFAPSTPATLLAHQPFKPQANPLTVHTRRNLRALANQARLKDKPQAGGAERRAATEFEHVLLLGHVSMLTAIATAVRAGRPYVVTADRDEHIRVSRGAPQAHVVETFCLGHGDFVSRLCVPPGRPELLVSGGGDDALFVWDWFAGKLLSTADLSSLVQAVLPDRTQLAVSTLRAFQYLDPENSEGGTTWVVAGCEAVPALFFFQLEGNNLLHVQTVQFEGNLLDAVPFETQTGPRLLAALDGPKGLVKEDEDVTGEPSLVALNWDVGSGWQASPFSVGDGTLDDGEANVTRGELKKSLYTVEALRKMDYEEE